MAKEATLSMRIPTDVKEALAKAAALDDRSVASLATKLFREHCERVGTLQSLSAQQKSEDEA